MYNASNFFGQPNIQNHVTSVPTLGHTKKLIYHTVNKMGPIVQLLFKPH